MVTFLNLEWKCDVAEIGRFFLEFRYALECISENLDLFFHVSFSIIELNYDSDV